MAKERSGAACAAGSLEQLMAACGYGPESAAAAQLTAFLSLLQKWNARVNLTADAGWPAVGWLFEEALRAARFYPEGVVHHLDVGSGAGFPAVPLKILRPSMQLRLVESRARRAAFLETVAAELRLQGVTVVGRRIEEYLREGGTPAPHIVTWKGIKLSAAALKLLAEHGRPDTQFWLFHGRELPLAAPAAAAVRLRLLRRAELPGCPGRRLSIFAVSRETCST